MASDAADDDGFGRLLVRDGDRLVVASEMALYAFERAEAGWSEIARLPLETPLGAGAGLLLSGDLVLLGPGVTFRRGGGTPDEPGVVSVFRRSGDGWAPAGTLAPAAGAPGDRFGASFAAAGGLVFVGAPGFDVDGVEAAGAVFAFREADDGTLEQVGEPIVPASPTARAGLGTGLLAVEEDGELRLFVAAGGAGGTGAAFEFVRSEEGAFVSRTVFLPPTASDRARFARSLARIGDELWIGGTVDRNREGRIFRYAREDDDWTFRGTLAGESLQRNSAFGSALDGTDRLAVVAASGKDYGLGTAYVFALAGDGWRQVAEVWGEVAEYAGVEGGDVPCRDGKAADFDCSGVDIRSYMPVSALGAGRGVETNDVWGWTDPSTGREYALVGMTDQASFVDITDANDPRLVGILPMPETANGSTWRDIKVYEDHAFVVSDGAGDHGMQVFDLTRLRDVGEGPVTFSADAHYDGVASAHNVVINEASGFAYIVGASGGGETCGGGLHMVDVRRPTSPTFVGCFADATTGRRGTGYSHDAMCIDYDGPDREHAGKEICFGANETALSIADVSDKTDPAALSTASYPNVGYAHQGWITEDHRYFYLDDELDEIADARDGSMDMPGTRTMIWDVSDLDDPVLVKEHFGETVTSDHNLYIVGDYAYQSNYVSGLRILDIRDPENPEEVAFFDTVPYMEAPGFAGSWSNYPFFESGTIVVTSGSEGLFMLRHRQPALVP